MTSTYKYHVDYVKCFGHIEETRTFKFDTFSEAFDKYNFFVEVARESTCDYWTVSLTETDTMRLRFYVTELDFSE